MDRDTKIQLEILTGRTGRLSADQVELRELITRMDGESVHAASHLAAAVAQVAALAKLVQGLEAQVQGMASRQVVLEAHISELYGRG